MKKGNVTNKDIMKRLDDLEKRNTIISGVILLYSIAIAFLIGYFSIEGIQGDLFLILGIVCYASGMILSLRKKIKI